MNRLRDGRVRIRVRVRVRDETLRTALACCQDESRDCAYARSLTPIRVGVRVRVRQEAFFAQGIHGGVTPLIVHLT